MAISMVYGLIFLGGFNALVVDLEPVNNSSKGVI
jgi:hypothetical protein